MRRLAVMLFWISAVVLVSANFFSCPTHAPAGESMRINGSGTGLEMMKPLIRAYLESNPGVEFEMEKPLGSAGALKALIAGALDIAVSSKPLNPEDIRKGARLSRFGKTPLTIVTGSNVPITDISTEELEAIYSGRIRKWPNNENIRVVLRPLEDTDTKILRTLSPNMDEAVTQALTLRGTISAVTDPESDQAVANTIGSIGTAALAGIMVEKIPVNVLALNGIMPTVQSLENGRYPLAKDLHFVTMSPLSVSAQKFLDFIYSDRGRDIVKGFGVLTFTGKE